MKDSQMIDPAAAEVLIPHIEALVDGLSITQSLWAVMYMTSYVKMSALENPVRSYLHHELPHGEMMDIVGKLDDLISRSIQRALTMVTETMPHPEHGRDPVDIVEDAMRRAFQ
jgi:hypothetical protein